MISSSSQNPNPTWYVYILECNDNTLYTGVTTNLERRLHEHNTNNARCARYVKSRRPARLVYWENQPDRSEAIKRESAIKKFKKKKKLSLINKVNI